MHWTVQTSLMELTTLGIKNAETLAVPSVRNDAAFLFTVDWGFFVPSMLGSISLVNIQLFFFGSIFCHKSFCILLHFRLLQAAISGFSSFFPDYQNRIASREAAHFLEHVNLIDERLEKLIYRRALDAKEQDRLAVVAMAGFAAQGLDLLIFSLYRKISLLRSSKRREQRNKQKSRWHFILRITYAREKFQQQKRKRKTHIGLLFLLQNIPPTSNL
ncbi:hypothetical protein D8674_000225 [Pyrus ussuriensis x Pyrus communis]|uniref:Uncharacterized protein n=1 Tax=Pyrus ussuriensis x Pyrus communis TaxID=2448454 RepID=A0A5N5F2U8_9ROSA|nr:hypothetical protein D8674_000225 [Pyrus ussuriensis x Pyrus communis]